MLSLKTVVKAWVLVVGLVFSGFVANHAAGQINRHLPFSSTVQRNSKNNSLNSSIFATQANCVYWSKEFDPKRYAPFGGMALNLRDMADSYNYYFSQMGLPNKNYFPGTGPTGLAQFSHDAPMESYLNTAVKGAELSLYKKFDGLFDDSFDQVPHLDALNKLVTGAQLFFGANLPVMSAKRTAVYQPSYFLRMQNKSRDGSSELLDEQLRTKVSEFAKDAGLDIYHWSTQGFGDLDLYVGLGNRFEYVLHCANIDVAAAIGITLPTGQKFDINNPLSFSLGREGYSIYGNLMLQVELRRGLIVGTEINVSSGSKSTLERRIPLKNEPEGWSPLKDKLTISSGVNFKIAPYVEFKNFMDWMFDFKVGFTYLETMQNDWIDVRKNKDIKMFAQDLTNMSGRNKRIVNSGWSAKYFNLKLTYDGTKLFTSKAFRPEFWASYDYPWERTFDVPNYKFGLGMTVKF